MNREEEGKRMLDGRRIADELYEMTDALPGKVLHRAVERIHQAGAPYDWVGIYLLNGDNLVLHSYIGRPTDLTRIAVGEGVCGIAVAEERDINVPDVEAFEGYLACSTHTRSEVVVLIKDGDRILGEIDIDSDSPAAFGPAEERELRAVADALGEVIGGSLR